MQFEQEKMLGALEKTSKFIYDTSKENLTQITKSLLAQAREDLKKSKEASKISLLKGKGSKWNLNFPGGKQTNKQTNK